MSNTTLFTKIKEEPKFEVLMKELDDIKLKAGDNFDTMLENILKTESYMQHITCYLPILSINRKIFALARAIIQEMENQLEPVNEKDVKITMK